MGLSEDAKQTVIDLLKSEGVTAVDEDILETMFADRHYEAIDIPDNAHLQYYSLAKLISDYFQKANDKLRKENEELKKKANQDKETSKDWAVLCVSEAAKDAISRTEFRKKQVPEELCPGGFVCHPMHVEFVKAARSMSSNPQEQNTDSVEQEKQKIEQVAKTLEEKFGSQLSERQLYPFFSEDYPDEDPMQSMWFVKCLRDALQLMGAPTLLVMEHQFNLVSKWKHRTIKKDSPNLRLKISDPAPPTQKKAKVDTSSNEQQGVKIDTRMDGFCFLATEGTPPIATFEYKPNNVDTEHREARADMCASNVQAVLGKPCLSVDVAGGNRPNEWEISAYALAPRPEGWPGESTHRWDKCPLYQGTGFTGLVRLAAGIVATLPRLSERRNQFGSRMGPVVGVDGKRVFKGYDCTTTREPNMDLIREFVDEKAKLWTTSEGGTLEILEMELLENIWNDTSKLHNPVSVTVLISILASLIELHKKNLVHGDLRLANMLSCGKIVDFDFAGEDGEQEYPEGLQEVPGDGERHPDVSSWIQDGSRTPLVMKKEHDRYSMKKVMCLFEIHPAGSDDDESNVTTLEKAWSDSIDLVGDGNVKKAIEVLEKHTETMKLVLVKEITHLLRGATNSS